MTAEEALKEIRYLVHRPWDVMTLQEIVNLLNRYDALNRPPIDDDVPF